MSEEQFREEAESFYQEARARWSSAVRLSVYDDETVIGSVSSTLERALEKDPNHVKSLSLLSDLLMEMGAEDDARPLMLRLRELEPDSQAHREKLALLERVPDAEKWDEIRHFLETKWKRTQEW